MADLYEDTIASKQVPFPAALANGRRVVHLFGIEGTREIYPTLGHALEAAQALPPLPDQPEVA